MTQADVQVIIPVKRLSEAKSRLRPVLGEEDREALVVTMLTRVIDTARTARRVADVTIVTADPRVGRLATARGARCLGDEGADLNASLSGAMRHSDLARRGAWLILPGDLPDLTADAVDALLAGLDAEERMVIAPDQHLSGTNALAWRGAPFSRFRFGRDSFAAHRRAGHAAGFTVVAHPTGPEFFDLDDAEGLARIGGFPRPARGVASFLEARAHA